MTTVTYYIAPFVGFVGGIIYGFARGRGVVVCALLGALAGFVISFAIV